MNTNKKQQDVVEKFRVFRAHYDKYFILSAGGLWVISTIWDICKLQRYWLDYTLEFYSCFFIIFMMIYSVKRNLLPKKVYHSFRLITTMRGRGTLLLMISTIFLCDSHFFHKVCAILLFIGGISYFLCEILVPTTREEFQQIKALFCLNRTNNQNNNNASETANNMNEVNITNVNDMIRSNMDMNKNKEIINGINNNNSEGENKKDGENKEDETQKESIEKLDEETPKVSDNPYEIPEDF